MSKLREALENKEFVVTSEMAPPKGTDFTHIIECAKLIKGRVHAVNVTDFQSAAVKATSLGMCLELKNLGLEPVLQVTGRDRNRIAIQGELLTAGHFGIENVLSLTGDHTVVGDNPQAKPVYDLDSIGILQAAEILMTGEDMGGNKLEGIPEFFLGASITPEYEPFELQMMKTKLKIFAGAKFFQTQGVYEIETMRKLREATKDMGIYILAGIIPLKSAGMAKYMNKNVPGINVPEYLIERLQKSENKVQEGIKIAAELIKQLKEENLCEGVHIMAIGAEENVPLILDAAGL